MEIKDFLNYDDFIVNPEAALKIAEEKIKKAVYTELNQQAYEKASLSLQEKYTTNIEITKKDKLILTAVYIILEIGTIEDKIKILDAFNEVYANDEARQLLIKFEGIRKEEQRKKEEEEEKRQEEIKNNADFKCKEASRIAGENGIIFGNGRYKLNNKGEVISKTKGAPMVKYLDEEKQDYYVEGKTNGEKRRYYLSDIGEKKYV